MEEAYQQAGDGEIQGRTEAETGGEDRRQEPAPTESVAGPQPPAPAPQPLSPNPEAELLEVRRRWLESHQRALLAEMAAIRIPAGSPVRQGPNPESMSPMEKIAYGLKRSEQ